VLGAPGVVPSVPLVEAMVVPAIFMMIYVLKKVFLTVSDLKSYLWYNNFSMTFYLYNSIITILQTEFV